jgi:hypothetical protein
METLSQRCICLLFYVCESDHDDAYKILVRKSEEKRPHRRPTLGWEDNIKMYLKEMKCGLDSSGQEPGN